MEPERFNNQTQVTKTKNLPAILTPLAIVCGFAMIAVAVFFSGGGAAKNQAGLVIPTTEQGQPTVASGPDNVAPVTKADWIRGNPNAPIQIVEYSDYDCPFCKDFHETMKRVINEYGSNGQVAWVYRHFPLTQLHPNAPAIAQAAECVGHLGGNEAFWTFSDLVFSERGTNEATDMSKLAGFAQTAGVATDTYNNCVNNETYLQNVEADFENAAAVGGRGTPYSVIIVGDQTGVINGAQPYNTVKNIVETLLAQLEG